MSLNELYNKILDYLRNELNLTVCNNSIYSNLTRPSFNIKLINGFIDEVSHFDDVFLIKFINGIQLFIYEIDNYPLIRCYRHHNFFINMFTDKRILIKLLKSYKIEKSNYFNNILKRPRTENQYTVRINLLNDELGFTTLFIHQFEMDL